MTAKQWNEIEYKKYRPAAELVGNSLGNNQTGEKHLFFCESLFFAIVARRKNKSALFLLQR